MQNLNRRQFLRGTAQSLAFGLCASSIGLPALTRAQAASLSWANLMPGFTILISEYLRAKGLDKEYRLNLQKPTTYASVGTYYNDFIAGNYDVCIGSWDTFAARYLAGVKVQFVCGISTGSMINILTPSGGEGTLEALKGKIFAAPQSSGTYRMMRAVIKELHDIDLEQYMRVQNVDNPAAAVTLAMADRADAVLSWEPNISAGLVKAPDMRVLYNAGDEYRKRLGKELPYFGIAVRREVAERDPELVQRLDQAFGACVNGIMGDVDEAVGLTAERSGFPPEVLKLAITSGRMALKHLSMGTPDGRDAVRTAAGFLIRNGSLPRQLDDGFFAV
tara:strand:+ start:1289 stop:2287 length:999 start_codon:yes stop_codon:yes gene_type:complete